jgi:hypothetical protein
MKNDGQANFEFDVHTDSSHDEPQVRSPEEAPSDPDQAFARAEQHSLTAMITLIERCIALNDDYLRCHGSHAFSAIAFNRAHLVESAVRESIDRLIQRARLQFGFAGREAPIDPSEIYARYLPSQRRRMLHDAPETDPYAYKPEATWDHLKNTYQSTGRQMAMTATANVLLAKLPIGSNSSDRIRQAGAFTVFDLYVRAEPRSSITRGKGQYQLCSHECSHDRLPALADALATFIAWTKNSERIASDVAADVKAMKDFVFDYAGFDLRHKMQIGPITFTFFKSKAEMKMSTSLAESLNLFLTEFAAEKLRDRMS